MYVRTYVCVYIYTYICLYGSNIYIYNYIYMRESMYNPHSIPMKPSPAPRFPPRRTNPASQRHGAMDPRNPPEAVRDSRRFMSWWVLWSTTSLNRYRYIIIIINFIITIIYIYNQTYSMCISIYIYTWHIPIYSIPFSNRSKYVSWLCIYIYNSSGYMMSAILVRMDMGGYNS